MGLFIIGVVVLEANMDSWADQQLWIINATANSYDDKDGKPGPCKEYLERRGVANLGVQETFVGSCILFYTVGMGFGCSSSLSVAEFDCIRWVKTSLKKRLIRATIGALIATGMYFAFEQIPWIEDSLTFYFFKRALPYFLIPFIMHGPYLILCQKIGLVDDEATIKQREEE